MKDIPPGEYRNDWPIEWGEPIVLSGKDIPSESFDCTISGSGFTYDLMRGILLGTKPLSAALRSYVASIRDAVDAVEPFVRDLFSWEYAEPPAHPIRDKSQGGWAAWYDGRWRKCYRSQGVWRWQ